MVLRYEIFVRCDFLTASVMKSVIFWDITPCSSLKVVRSDISEENVASIFRVEDICRLALLSCFLYNPSFLEAHCSACFLIHAVFLVASSFEPEDGGYRFL
jgi:hypothetical protein